MREAFIVCLIFISRLALAQFTAVQNSPVVSEALDSHGVAWIDYDNDGDDDLFVTISSYETEPSLDVLYKNNGDGTFTKITTGALVTESGTGRNSTWGDFNNDGFIDAFVANQLETSLFINSANGVFTKQESLPTTSLFIGSDHSGAAWGDYDGDGFLDLFLASYKIHDNAKNQLYHNNGNGTFTELPTDNIVSTPGYSFDPSWIDYDNNGTLDLFVPNYSGTNYLYTNQGDGTFKAFNGAPITSDNLALGGTWADYDNDGDFDVLIITNVNTRNLYFENNGDGTFTEKINNTIAGVVSTGVTSGDFDNDGWIDVILVGCGQEGKSIYFKNNGDKTFTNVSAEKGITNTNYSYAVANADYNKDGFLDVFIANGYGNNHPVNDILYRNTPNANGFISIHLTGKKTNRSAIGANVRLKSGNKWQMRSVQSKTGYGGQNSLTVHFGLGTAAVADSILIEWPMRGYQVLTNSTKNQFLDVPEIDFVTSPGELKVSNTEAGLIGLNWLDNSNEETGFRIERSKGNNHDFMHLTTVAANTLSFNDTHVESGITYYYRIAATMQGGYSAYSNVDSVTTLITGIENASDRTLVAYPNPFNDELTIRRISDMDEQVRILNTSGQVVLSSMINNASHTLSLKHLPSGLYVLIVANQRIKILKK